MFDPVEERRVKLPTGGHLPDIGKRLYGYRIGAGFVQPQGVEPEIVEPQEDTDDGENYECLDIPACSNKGLNVFEGEVMKRFNGRFISPVKIALTGKTLQFFSGFPPLFFLRHRTHYLFVRIQI